MSENEIILVYPNADKYSPYNKAEWNVEHLGLAYLKSALNAAGFSASILNGAFLQLSAEEIVSNILEKSPKFVGFSVTCFTIKSALFIAREIKKNDSCIHICFGGHHATSSSDEILSNSEYVDSVVRGDGEETIVEVMRALEGGTDLEGIKGVWYKNEALNIVRNDERAELKPLDSLAWPHRSDTAINNNCFGLNTSRGCIYSCRFCSTPKYSRIHGGELWRARNEQDIINEIENLSLYKSDNSIVDLSILDDNFIISSEKSKERAKNIAQKLILKQLNVRLWMMCSIPTFRTESQSDAKLLVLLRNAGFDRLFVGIESGSSTDLTLYSKPTSVKKNIEVVEFLSSFGFAIHCTMIIFHPFSTIKELKDNLFFLKRLLFIPSVGMYTNVCSRLAVFPGTEFYDKMITTNKIDSTTAYLNPFPYKFADLRVEFIFSCMEQFEQLFGEVDSLICGLRTKLCQNRILISDSFFKEVQNLIRDVHNIQLGCFSKCIDRSETNNLEGFEHFKIETFDRITALIKMLSLKFQSLEVFLFESSKVSNSSFQIV